MFQHILTQNQKSVLELLRGLEALKSFYLAGGTGLALQLGHRRSIDFDLFTDQPFRSTSILPGLSRHDSVLVLQETGDSLILSVQAVSVSFFRCDYPLLRP